MALYPRKRIFFCKMWVNYHAKNYQEISVTKTVQFCNFFFCGSFWEDRAINHSILDWLELFFVENVCLDFFFVVKKYIFHIFLGQDLKGLPRFDLTWSDLIWLYLEFSFRIYSGKQEERVKSITSHESWQNRQLWIPQLIINDERSF